MKLPRTPLPAIMEQSPGGRHLHAYSEAQIATYGLACAEAMREECAKACEQLANHEAGSEASWVTRSCASAIRSIEV